MEHPDFRLCLRPGREDEHGKPYWVAKARGTGKYICALHGDEDDPEVYAAVDRVIDDKGLERYSERHKKPRQVRRPNPYHSRVETVAWWAKHGHFKNEDEVRGAMKLAYQQGLDGLGDSIPGWMGLTQEQYAAWIRQDWVPSAN